MGELRLSYRFGTEQGDGEATCIDDKWRTLQSALSTYRHLVTLTVRSMALALTVS